MRGVDHGTLGGGWLDQASSLTPIAGRSEPSGSGVCWGPHAPPLGTQGVAQVVGFRVASNVIDFGWITCSWSLNPER